MPTPPHSGSLLSPLLSHQPGTWRRGCRSPPAGGGRCSSGRPAWRGWGGGGGGHIRFLFLGVGTGVQHRVSGWVGRWASGWVGRWVGGWGASVGKKPSRGPPLAASPPFWLWQAGSHGRGVPAAAGRRGLAARHGALRCTAGSHGHACPLHARTRRPPPLCDQRPAAPPHLGCEQRPSPPLLRPAAPPHLCCAQRLPPLPP